MYSSIKSPADFHRMDAQQKQEAITQLHETYINICNDAQQAYRDTTKFGEMTTAYTAGDHLLGGKMAMAVPSPDFRLYILRAEPYYRLVNLLDVAETDENTDVQGLARSLSAKMLRHMENLRYQNSIFPPSSVVPPFREAR